MFAGLLVFVALQALLASYNISVTREAIERGLWERSPYNRLTVLSQLFPRGFAEMITFVCLSACGAVIASRGDRVLFASPGIAYVLASVVLSPQYPESVGHQWALACFDYDVTYTTCATPWFGHPWLGLSVDLGLMLVPGFMIARRVRPRRWPGRTDAATIAALVSCAAAGATAVWAMVVVQNGVDLSAVAAVGAVGLILGSARPWWPWFHVIVALALADGFAWLLDRLFWPQPYYPLSSALPAILAATWPIVAVASIASMWQPLAWLIRRLEERPLRLVIAVNLLNVADAMLTFLAIRSGGAYESNPFVRNAGLPLKIVFVGALTWLAYRRKPSALVWPFAILVWVAAYHVAGMFVNAWR